MDDDAQLLKAASTPAYDPVMASTATEGREIAQAKAKALAAMSWQELDAYGRRTEEVTSPTGRRFRVKSFVFWDMEEWASGMYIIVKAYPPNRWRRPFGYSAVETRGGPDDLVPERPE
jgi:hypothetical protein